MRAWLGTLPVLAIVALCGAVFSAYAAPVRPSAPATAGPWHQEVVGNMTVFFCTDPAACGKDAKVGYVVGDKRRESATLAEFRELQRGVIGRQKTCVALCERIAARLDDARLRKSGPHTILIAYLSETRNGKPQYALSGLVFGPKRWLQFLSIAPTRRQAAANYARFLPTAMSKT